MRGYVLPLILAIFTGLALLVGMMFFVKPSGVYYKYTGSDTKIKAYPVILYYDEADGKVTPKVFVELQNLGTAEATYFIKYENETKDVSLAEEGSVKVEVTLNELNRDESKFVTKYISIYKNGQDESNKIVEVPVFLIVDMAPVIETNHTKFPKFIIAQRNEESLVFYVDVDDSKAISNVTITLANTTPITITGIHYSDVLLNNNVWEKIVVNYKVKDSALKDKLYEITIPYKVTYEDNTTLEESVDAYFIYTTALGKLYDKYEAKFEDITNLG